MFLDLDSLRKYALPATGLGDESSSQGPNDDGKTRSTSVIFQRTGSERPTAGASACASNV